MMFFAIVIVVLVLLIGALGIGAAYPEKFELLAKIVIDIEENLSKTQENVIPINESEFAPLTEELKPNFDSLVIKSANNNNADVLIFIYKFSNCKVNIGIIEIIFRNFLLRYYNLPLNYSLSIYVEIEGDELYLYCALTLQGQRIIDKEKANRRSRQIPVSTDLLD